MTIKTLYRYYREDGGLTVSTVPPENISYDTLSRLIADEDKVLTKDGKNFTPCIDIENSDIDDWYEIMAKEE